MKQWSYERLAELVHDADPQRMFARAVNLVEELDLQYVGLTLHLHIATQLPKVISYNNYPPEWNALYCQERYLTIDPTVSKCHQTTLPLLWSDTLFEEVPHLREVACMHGLVHGWTQSVHDLRHNESQLSVSRPSGAIDSFELYSKSAQIMWLCHTLHAALSDHHLGLLSPALQLSERELEVLKWSAAGKTASDVATILSLSTSTVNFHIRSVINKTNASNKAGAVAIAALRGLL